MQQMTLNGLQRVAAVHRPRTVSTAHAASRPRRALQPFQASTQLTGPLLDLAEGAAAGGLSPAVVLLPLAACAGGVAALRFFLYSQLEVVTASMLTRYVPKGNAKVIQVGGGSKEVFYYPKDAMSVTAVGMDFNKGLMQQAGMQAGVPTVVRSQDPDDLSWLADGTVDAVVVLRRLGRMTPATRKAALSEASRVLKPGRPLIFIERVREGGSPLRPLLGGSEGALATSELEALRDNSRAWSYVQWDVALAGQDPHAVGVAVRSEAALPRKARQAAAAAAEAKEAPKAPPKRAKGFSA